jgi:hypothetical protein
MVLFSSRCKDLNLVDNYINPLINPHINPHRNPHINPVLQAMFSEIIVECSLRSILSVSNLLWDFSKFRQ